jgi:hypothetical protein
MMKVIQYNAVLSAVTSASAMAVAVVELQTTPSSFIQAILNSLFRWQIHLSAAANPMNFRLFWCEAVVGLMKTPVIFPVSREFTRLRTNEINSEDQLIRDPG